MNYPNRLLPQPNFKIIHWDELLKNHYLIHYTPTKDLIDPETKKLKIEYVVRQTNHLRDYSNNLLGVFLVEDIFWVPVKKSPKVDYFGAAWKDNTPVLTPNIPEDYIKDEERGYFFMKISDCHSEIVEFNDGTFASPECIVLHTPINANFWHFSLRWLFEGKDLQKWSGAIERRMRTSAKAFILEKAFFEEPFFEEIEAHLYNK
ncbi:hypothetical protein BH23BAC1_BH23BAC1_50220 [soil metagenome]